jgi:hypothetical protein
MSRGLFSSVVPVSLIASLILLAGCTISVDGGGTDDPFPGETVETVSVRPDFESDPVRTNVTLSAGTSRIYKVNISDSVAQNNDVVYFDAVPLDGTKVSGYLEVTSYSVVGSQATPLYVSQSNEWFGRPNDPGLTSAAALADFAPTSITSGVPACGGPCVVVPTPSGGSTAYIRVEGIQSTTTFDLYVVATTFSDVGEPNDTFSNAEVVGGDLFVQGAIEIIGDTDWYVPDSNVAGVTFSGNNDLNLLANVYTESGSFRSTLSDGQTYILPPDQALQGLRVEVYSDSDQERAAGAGRALYSIEYQ